MCTCDTNSWVISCSMQLNHLMKRCLLFPSQWRALHGNLKGKVYKNNPHSTEALQNEITHVIWLNLWLWKQTSETPVSCAKRLLTIFENWSVAVPQYPEPFLQSTKSSSIASLCHTVNLWPATFSQAWIQKTLWELASQDIYDKTYGYIFWSFFPC
jgi:hypothetical protein